MSLVDAFGRVHDDLRLSVTDRCNLRCAYCMPADPEWFPRERLLSYEEIVRLARILVGARTVERATHVVRPNEILVAGRIGGRVGRSLLQVESRLREAAEGVRGSFALPGRSALEEGDQALHVAAGELAPEEGLEAGRDGGSRGGGARIAQAGTAAEDEGGGEEGEESVVEAHVRRGIGAGIHPTVGQVAEGSTMPCRSSPCQFSPQASFPSAHAAPGPCPSPRSPPSSKNSAKAR